jgi:hypothetical protein
VIDRGTEVVLESYLGKALSYQASQLAAPVKGTYSGTEGGIAAVAGHQKVAALFLRKREVARRGKVPGLLRQGFNQELLRAAREALDVLVSHSQQIQYQT